MLLGSPVGRSPTAIEACLREEYKAHESLFTLLKHEKFPLQAAYLLGRISGVPKINHNLRSVHPRFMSNIAHEFDERIRGLLTRRLFLGKEGLTRAADAQMSLPIRLAGLGIARQKENAAIAWLSSLLESLPSFLGPEGTLPPFYETLRLEALDLATTELHQLGRHDLAEKMNTIFPKDAVEFTRRAWEPLPRRERKDAGPNQPDDLAAALDEAEKEHKHSRVQACASRILVEARLWALKARVVSEGESQAHVEARFKSLTSAENGTLFKMLPTRNESTLSDGALAHSIRLRLNAAKPDLFTICRLCHYTSSASNANRPPQDNHFHALHCTALQAEATATHHRVVKALIRVINDHLGLRASISGRKLTGEDVNGKGGFLIPDGEILCGESGSISVPLSSPRHLTRARTPLGHTPTKSSKSTRT